MSNMLEYQAFCTSNATGDPCPRRDDRVAPRSSTAYNGTFNQNVGGVIDSWNAPQRFTIVGRSPRGLPACMSKDGRACLWLDRELCVSRLYETADWTTPLLECGAANKALYNETGFEEPTHWCSRAVWLWPWAYPDAPEPRPPPPRPTRTSTGVPQSTRRPSSAGRQTAGFCGTIATAMIVAFLM
ncbi:hypothetical protein DFJ74DRAFT_672980 [Hyaloraphidium curvatum]|nr:hypothetical protein DFJ74DRAFT_672980 [Hyaloraphidium curvatum]